MAIKTWIGGLLGQRTEGDMDKLVRAFTDQGKFSGSVLVARRGAVLLSKSYGEANREHHAPNTPQTVFRIGSMTKPFTAIAIMQLIEWGQLTLDDPVSRYMPDYPNGDRITIHHLLSNTSGIPDYIVSPEYQQIARQHVSPSDLTAIFRHKPLQFEPGSDIGYSNSGWVLLGIIAEHITGLTYGDLIRKNIFQPAGMVHSGYEWEQPLIPHRATGYVDTGAGLFNATFHDETTMHGAGGLYATTEDLYRWALALEAGTLLQPALLQQMSAADFGAYGYGWELYTLCGQRAVAHSGGLPGYVSNFVRFPEANAVIIILSNLGSAALSLMTETLAAILFGQPYQMPAPYTFIQVDPALLQDYVGEFTVTYFGRTSILKFVVEGENLTMIVIGLPKAVMSAFSDTHFYARSKGDVELTFVRDTAGVVNTIDLNWAGHKLTATRMG